MSLNQDQVMEYFEKMTLLEAADFAKAFEDKFGVTAAAPVAVAAPGAAAGGGDEQTEFTVILKAVPADKKIATIKEVRSITGLGLKEAKELVEGAPKEIKADLPKEEAEKIKAAIEKAGSTAELK